MFMLLRLPLALGILTLPSPGLDQVSIESRTGLAYEMRMTRTMSMRLGEASMHVGGQEFPADMVKGSVPDRDDVETVVLRNIVKHAEDGRPVQVLREFVERTMQRTVADETTDLTGALEGKQLVLERGADGDVEARFEKGVEETVDDAYLAGHLLEHGIHRLMPEASVELGESWMPDDDAVRAMLISPGPQYYENKESAELPILLEKQAEFTVEMNVEQEGMAIQIKMELTANNASSREREILE